MRTASSIFDKDIIKYKSYSVLFLALMEWGDGAGVRVVVVTVGVVSEVEEEGKALGKKLVRAPSECRISDVVVVKPALSLPRF